MEYCMEWEFSCVESEEPLWSKHVTLHTDVSEVRVKIWKVILYAMCGEKNQTIHSFTLSISLLPLYYYAKQV